MSKKASNTGEAGLLYGVDPNDDNVVNPLKITTGGGIMIESQAAPANSNSNSESKRARTTKNTGRAGILFGVDPNDSKVVNPVKVTSDGKLLVEIVDTGGGDQATPSSSTSMPAWASTNW